VDLRIGVMQLTMEPLDEMLASARAMDEAGMDTIWLAEAYPWWRKHGMEARSSTGVAALMGRETKRLTIGWGIIAASTRHPVQAAMDARVVQEAAGPGRFILGFGTSKIFLNNTKTQTKKTLGPMRDAVLIARGVLSGERFEYDGDTWSADVPALAPDAHAPREVPPVYLANKVQNIQGAADTLLELAGIEQEEIRPVAEAMEQGGRLAAKAKVSDALLDKCRPIAGTPSDCIEAIEEYRDAGCSHVMLELWGANRHEQIRLFGEKVLPQFRRG
jgi:alkanesulfonate monooxygenase SsuD/methylene tetrahydromethanopterin reductase-like flavin-dependent oxidoreductase (luciferase family)